MVLVHFQASSMSIINYLEVLMLQKLILEICIHQKLKSLSNSIYIFPPLMTDIAYFFCCEMMQVLVPFIIAVYSWLKAQPALLS